METQFEASAADDSWNSVSKWKSACTGWVMHVLNSNICRVVYFFNKVNHGTFGLVHGWVNCGGLNLWSTYYVHRYVFICRRFDVHCPLKGLEKALYEYMARYCYLRAILFNHPMLPRTVCCESVILNFELSLKT